MIWSPRYHPKAEKELDELDFGIKMQYYNVLERVLLNPLPKPEGGHGKPLRGKLAGCCKIVLKSAGLRVVYKVHRTEKEMYIYIISIRDDGYVYKETEKRL